MMYLRHLLILILVGLLSPKEAKAYSISFQSVTCNILTVTLTLESWEYQQGSFIALYSSIQDTTNRNGLLFQMGLSNQYTSTSLTHQIKFINNRVSTFAGRSSVAIGITDIEGKLLPYLGSGDPDIATLSFSAPQGCGTSLQSTTSSSIYTTSTISYTEYTSFSMSTSTMTRSSSSISTSSSNPYIIITPTPTPTPSLVHKSNSGAIAGGAIGGSVVLFVIMMLACCLCRRKKKQDAPSVTRNLTTSNNSPLIDEDIEKDLKNSNFSDEEYNTAVLERENHPTASGHDNMTADIASQDERMPHIDSTSSTRQTEKGTPESTIKPDNPLLRHMPKM